MKATAATSISLHRPAGMLAVKRLFDMVAAAIGVIVLFPVLVLVAVAVKIDSPGPALFLQTRVGRGGRPFRIIKFRSMHCRHDPALPRLTVAGDPRVTRVGHFIRRTKLDELPQLFNVLAGSMSLVGPRPEVEEFMKLYSAEQRSLLLSVRPGLTDFSSILLHDESTVLAASSDPERAYRETLLPMKAALSNRYRENMSLSLDIRILLATIWVLVTGKPPAWLDKPISPASPGKIDGIKFQTPTPFSDIKRITRPIVRNALSLSGLTALGQLTFLISLPLLTHLFDPTDIGAFTIYLSVVNICGPLVALKFESGLYAAAKREDARLIFLLCGFTMLGLSLLACVVVQLLGRNVSASPAILTMIPFGLFLAGSWSLTSAWAIWNDAIPTLSIARFLQPASMTVLQIAAGFAGFGGEGLILAHIVSHALYTGFIMARTVTMADLRAVRPLPLKSILRRARDNRHFPLFTMPAHVSSLMVSNLPPLVIGAVFGAATAGYVGVAYRIAAAPLAIISLPLGHILTSEAVRDNSLRHVRMLARMTLLASVAFVSLPLLLLAGFAPHVASLLFDGKWAMTGEILSALAIFTASQALLIPLAELTSIYRKQTRRLIAELTTSFLVFASLLFGAMQGWTALPTIWAMSLCGTAGTLTGLAIIWRSVLRTRPEIFANTNDACDPSLMGRRETPA